MKTSASSAPAPATSFTPAVFLALSSGLMGVPLSRLQAAANCLDFNRLFHTTVSETVPPDRVDRLVTTFLSASTVPEGAAEILLDVQLGPIGQSIIRLWRTGVWHNPAILNAPPRQVCDKAYRQSAVCHAVQAHAPADPLFATSP